MTIQQVLQTSPARVSEIFAKLGDTSNGSMKTREKLFDELKPELEMVLELEEKHLLPLLRRHQETKDIVPAAIQANREFRKQLNEIDAAPKDDDAFVQRLAALQKAFQQHVRDGKKELLPAVKKVLSEEEAREAATAMENGRNEAEQAKRDRADQQRQEAKAEREREERRRETDAASERSRKAAQHLAEEAARGAAENIDQAVHATREVTQRLAEGVADGTRRTVDAVRDTMGTYRSAAQSTAVDMEAVGALSKAASSAAAEVRAESRRWVGRSIQAGMRASGDLMTCRSPQQFAEMQRDFLAASMRNWLETGVRILEISQRTAGEALPALQSRLHDEGPSRKSAAR